MIHFLKGTLVEKGDRRAVIDVMGIGFAVTMTRKTVAGLPECGKETECVTYLHMKEDGAELYGFQEPAERMMFEFMTSVSGVGPKSALSLLEITDMESLAGAIQEGRADLLARASGIGAKTAERIVLELREKVRKHFSESSSGSMEGDADLEEALVGLGYRVREAREALRKVSSDIEDSGDRLKAALRILGGR